MAEKEHKRLAFEMYSPLMKFQNEKIVKQNLNAFFEKQGSRLAEHN